MKNRYRKRIQGKKIYLIMFFSFLFFLIANFAPKLGLDIYLLIRWFLFLSIPIILIYEFLINKNKA